VTLGLVLGTYALGDSIQHEAGLLAVTLMGFMLANQRVVRVQHIAEFKETLTTLLLACLFIVLAAGIQRADLAQLDGATLLFVLTLILVVRPIATFLSLATSKLPWQQKTFVAAVAPRGVVAIAVAALFASRLEGIVPDADRLVPTIFAVASGTVLIYGLGAAPLARALKLASKNPGGILLVGASAFAESLAAALKQEGVPVVLVDSNPRRLGDARMAGIQTASADATSAHPAEHIPMGGLGHMLALTPNEQVNRLATQQFAEFFGRGEVFRLQDGQDDRDVSGGRSLFEKGLTYQELSRRMAAGETVRATDLTEEFSLEAFMKHHGQAATPLLMRRGGKRTVPLTEAGESSPGAGDTLFYLAPEGP
jgi:CPA1 family monovalent cation:H+ antiporter